jgi:hypothetical protein
MALPIFASTARAQQVPPSDVPAAPGAGQIPETVNPGTANPAEVNPKNSRLFMIIPNYTTVEVPTKFRPLTVREKFKLGSEDAFDPYAFLLAGILAGKAQAQDDDPTWGQGLKGYGKRYAAGFGDATLGSFMTTGVFPSVFHEDPRYFREGEGSFWYRSRYAVKCLFVTRTDSNRPQFNFSEFGGNAAAAGIAMSYHSREERSLSTFTDDWITQIGIDFIANQLKEFWPDIRHKVLKR